MELTSSQKRWNFILTLIQYCGLALFLYWVPWVASTLIFKLIETLGLFLAIWAIAVMSKSKLNISPRPKTDAHLIKEGPYAFIRHPMYASIILSFLPLLLSYYSIEALSIFMVLVINLIFKLSFEEKLLCNYFDEYEEYKKHSWRLIPYIY